MPAYPNNEIEMPTNPKKITSTPFSREKIYDQYLRK